MEWKGGRYESQRQWCTVLCLDVSSGLDTGRPRLQPWLCPVLLFVWGLTVVGPVPRTCCVRGAGPTTSKLVLGGVLLSHTLAGAVPSALSGLASGFGMDAGRLPAAMTTETTEQAARNDRRLVRLFDYPCPAAYPHHT